MAKSSISILASAVQINMEGTVPTVSSKEVALRFQKKHKNILQDIERIRSMVPVDFYRLNFQPIEESVVLPHSGGIRKDKAYALTRDAFTLIAMGFTGKAAITWKLRYIEAFNALEQTVLQEQKLEMARIALSLTPVQYKRLRQVVCYRKRGFTYTEISKVMGIHQRTVNNLISIANRLCLTEKVHNEK